MDPLEYFQRVLPSNSSARGCRKDRNVSWYSLKSVASPLTASSAPLTWSRKDTKIAKGIPL